jgi:hypothetical protein
VLPIRPAAGEKHDLATLFHCPKVGRAGIGGMENAADPPQELHVVLAFQYDDHWRRVKTAPCGG